MSHFKPLALLLFFILSIFFNSCKTTANSGGRNNSNAIIVSSDFDAGSIGTLVESSANYLTGNTKHWKHKTSSDNQYYWFYFRLGHVLNKTVTIQLNLLEGIYRGKPHLIYTERTQPVFSYDNKSWNRIEDVKYNGEQHTLTFKNTFRQDSVWIAYAHPYPYSKEKAFLDSLPVNSSLLKKEELGTSAESRPINLLTISDFTVPEEKKKTVFITGLQHSGEYISGFFLEGMIRFLLSDQPDAARARKNITFKIIPMLNPDGIFHGVTRFNNNMEDLNQEWDDDFTDTIHLPVEPEVAAVKKWIRKWLKDGKTIDLGLDVHSQGQEGELNILHAPTDSLKGFVKNLNAYWPVEMIPLEFSGSENQSLSNEFHILSGTFEIPQSNIKGGKYLTIEDYESYGRGTAIGLADYFETPKNN